MSEVKYIRKIKNCKHELVFSNFCGAYICAKCDAHFVDHKGTIMMTKCFCGWRRLT